MMPTVSKIDIANTKGAAHLPVDSVGMSNIECPVLIKIDQSPAQLTAGLAEAYVNINAPQRGIHMSRLFLTLSDALVAAPISPKLLQSIAQGFLESHAELSHSAHVNIKFPLLLKRRALVSANTGWRSYPVSLWSTITPTGIQSGFEVSIRYSSTCPCSAALSRQLIQNKFAQDFPAGELVPREKIVSWLGAQESIAGVPHSQRSEGKAKFVFVEPPSDLSVVVAMIDTLESALGTPVQSAVKREDEQEFARLNASNLMFVEDAIRRMSAAVSSNPMFKGTSCEVYHFESLHPHDAVAKHAAGVLAGSPASWPNK